MGVRQKSGFPQGMGKTEGGGSFEKQILSGKAHLDFLCILIMEPLE